jgi:enoyl-CoA hydratase/carnithine racemase
MERMMLKPRPDVRVIEVPPLLTVGFAEELTEALVRAAADPSIRLVVFVGRENDVFSRGLDLEGVVAGRIAADAGLAAVAKCLRALCVFAKPKLAVVRGVTIGGGLGICAACDWVVASDTSSFAIPELLWGFVPAAIMPLLIRRVGAVRAQAWALTAITRPAAEALRIGLVDEVVPEAELAPAAHRAIRLFVRPDPAAVELLRTWSAVAENEPIEDAIERGAAVTAAWLARSEVREKLAVFFSDSDAVPWQAGSA